ncbi:MAG TPA: MFS transporter, partial [Pedococcus sp.]|nr:MFS transporter [Pedococcus sp.]
MTAEPEVKTAVTRAYRDPNVLRWVLGYLSSLVGDQIWFVALSWAAVQAGGPAQVGLVLAAGAVPRSALLLFGGALADRWGIRRVAIASDLTRTVLLIGAAAVALTLRPGVGWLVALSAAFGVVDALFLPAAAAMPQQLAAGTELTRVQGLRATAQRLATTVGAPVGGLTVAAAGVGGAFAVAAGGTVVSVGALALTRVRRGVPLSREPIVRAVRGGLVYTIGHPVLRPLLIMATLTELGFGGAVNAGLPILSHARGWGASGVG